MKITRDLLVFITLMLWLICAVALTNQGHFIVDMIGIASFFGAMFFTYVIVKLS